MIPSFVKEKEANQTADNDRSKTKAVAVNAEAWKEYAQPVNTDKWKEYVQPVNTEKWKEYIQPVNTEKWKEYIRPVNTEQWKEFAQPEKWKEFVQPVNTEKWKEYVQPVDTEKWKEFAQPEKWKEYAYQYSRVGETRLNLTLPAVKDYNLFNFVNITAPSGVSMAVNLPFPINEKGLSKLASQVRKSGGTLEYGDKA